MNTTFAQGSDDAVPAFECCATMLYPTGARTVSLGQALTARGGKDAMFINPASLADLKSDEIVVHRSTIVTDPMTTVSLIIHSRVAGVFGLTWRVIDLGTQTLVDSAGNPTGETTILDNVIIASYATTFAKSWSAGLNYRLYNQTSICRSCRGEGGTTQMVDLGVRYAPPWMPNLLLGASLMHAGFKLQVRNAEQADVTPLRLRLGAAYDARRLVTRDSTTSVWLHVDAVQRLRDGGAPGINAGVEVALDNTIFFRAGHASAADGVSFGGTAVGLGLKYQRFDVSIAKAVTATALADEPVYVTFGVAF